MEQRGPHTSTFIYVYSLLCILCIPFPYHIFPLQEVIATTVFSPITSALYPLFFGGHVINTEISSDSGSMYLLLLLLLVPALILTGMFYFFKFPALKRALLFYVIRTIICYYITLQLLKYGFDKVFKAQFAWPEPNLLYTPLGQLDKDILFWSSMGTSYLYSLVTGSFEIIAGLMLLSRRTRTVGLLLAAALLAHVFLVNLSFDISVKLYSFFLLFITLLLLAPALKPLARLLIFQKTSFLPVYELPFKTNVKIYKSSKALAIVLILTESLWPYMYNANFNDDAAPRPYLHGAYHVIALHRNDSLLPLHTSPVKRFFIYRGGYIIFQHQDDSFRDFKLETDSAGKLLYLTDYSLNTRPVPFNYNATDSTLTIRYAQHAAEYTLKGKALNWRSLPALQDEFHWRMND